MVLQENVKIKWTKNIFKEGTEEKRVFGEI